MTARVVVCDLDGVVWTGDDICPAAPDAVRRLRAAKCRVLFVTNSAVRSRLEVADRLGSMGIPTDPGDVITGAVAGVELLTNRLPIGSRVLTIGTEALRSEVSGAGFVVVTAVQPGASCGDVALDIDAVLVGLTDEFCYRDLVMAAASTRAGAWLVATNADPSFPHGGGELPGAGALVAAIETACGANATVAGKPHFGAYLALGRVLDRLGLTRGISTRSASGGTGFGLDPPRVAERVMPIPMDGVVVGDRRSTDGAFAWGLRWPFIEVRSSSSEPVGDVPVAASVRSLDEAADQICQRLL
ncbi:MAG: hypothetical protein H6512_03065 [Acidimicrobiia bacterium]|nr:hypothetical protein [Acidimicrobiia bacterium]